jgi:hypothetical protein
VAQKAYTSPDGLLTLLVKEIDGGEDRAIGFDGFPWHVHPGQLLGTYGDTVERALETFVSAILNSQEVILVTRKDGKVVDAFVPEDLEFSLKDAKEHNEEVELRYWDGSPAKVG